VSVVQTVLIYVLIPAAFYGVIALLTLWPKSARAARYRVGQPWTYDPVWWRAAGVVSANHTGTQGQTETTPADPSVRTAHGGARGNW
jgi:hypothetical protein